MAFPTSGYVNGRGLAEGLKGASDMGSGTPDTFYGALFDNTITGNDKDALEYYGTGPWATGGEVTSANYTAGGKALGAVSINTGATANRFTFKDTNSTLAWTSVTWTDARGLLVYNQTHASDLVVCCIDFTEDKEVTDGTFTVTWDTTNHIMYVSF